MKVLQRLVFEHAVFFQVGTACFSKFLGKSQVKFIVVTVNCIHQLLYGISETTQREIGV